MSVSILYKSFLVSRFITTSSNEAFPALSPIPFIVTSACFAPEAIPANVFATANPKSLWQCVEIIISLGSALQTKDTNSPYSAGLTYPTVSGISTMLAPASTTILKISTRKSVSVLVASSAANSTSHPKDTAYSTISWVISLASFLPMLNLYFKWISDVDNTTWILLLDAWDRASAATSISCFFARAIEQIIGALLSNPISLEIKSIALKSEGDAAAKPASIIGTFNKTNFSAIANFSFG